MVHFIVSGIQGSMIAACGLVISPKDAAGSRIGIFSQICHDCEVKVKQAWVTFK